jgi:hypothetical protein
MPIDILDGEHGEEFIEVNGCKIGKGIKKYDSLIVFSHFKGHIVAGFGAAIKNTGMGIGSRAGKLYMHSELKPYIKSEKCTACGACIKNCDSDAISMVEGKAQIKSDLCVGCAMCIAVCNFGAVQVPWEGGSSDALQKKQAEYTKAVLSLFKNPIFINVLQNITKDCDCFGVSQKPLMDDIGILYSTDIVAIDKASLDLAIKHSEGSFDKINSINRYNQIELAEKEGLGKSKYELIRL